MFDEFTTYVSPFLVHVSAITLAKLLEWGQIGILKQIQVILPCIPDVSFQGAILLILIFSVLCGSKRIARSSSLSRSMRIGHRPSWRMPAIPAFVWFRLLGLWSYFPLNLNLKLKLVYLCSYGFLRSILLISLLLSHGINRQMSCIIEDFILFSCQLEVNLIDTLLIETR